MIIEAKKAGHIRQINEDIIEEDIYDQNHIQNMLEDDQISSEEAGFMIGYYS